jgi:hypothetical protein
MVHFQLYISCGEPRYTLMASITLRAGVSEFESRYVLQTNTVAQPELESDRHRGLLH